MRVKARLRLAIQRVQLAKRIEALKAQDDTDDHDIPSDANHAADEALSSRDAPSLTQGRLSRAAKADIFRAVVLAKTKEMRLNEETENNERKASTSSPPLPQRS